MKKNVKNLVRQIKATGEEKEEAIRGLYETLIIVGCPYRKEVFSRTFVPGDDCEEIHFRFPDGSESGKLEMSPISQPKVLADRIAESSVLFKCLSRTLKRIRQEKGAIKTLTSFLSEAMKKKRRVIEDALRKNPQTIEPSASFVNELLMVESFKKSGASPEDVKKLFKRLRSNEDFCRRVIAEAGDHTEIFWAMEEGIRRKLVEEKFDCKLPSH